MTTRRTYLATIGAVATSTGALAGCLGGGGGSGSSKFDGYLSDTSNFDGSVTDETGSDTVTVKVGTQGNNGANAFSPAAVTVSTGTTVRWKWTGRGSHNVIEENGDFRSDLMATKGETFEHTFDETGTYKYYCRPHKTLGMKGVVVVE